MPTAYETYLAAKSGQGETAYSRYLRAKSAAGRQEVGTVDAPTTTPPPSSSWYPWVNKAVAAVGREGKRFTDVLQKGMDRQAAEEANMEPGLARFGSRMQRTAVGGVKFIASAPEFVNSLVNPEQGTSGEAVAEAGRGLVGSFRKVPMQLALTAEDLGRDLPLGTDENYRAGIFRGLSRAVNPVGGGIGDLRYVEDHGGLTPTEVQAQQEYQQDPSAPLNTLVMGKGIAHGGASLARRGMGLVRPKTPIPETPRTFDAPDKTVITPEQSNAAMMELQSGLNRGDDAYFGLTDRLRQASDVPETLTPQKTPAKKTVAPQSTPQIAPAPVSKPVSPQGKQPWVKVIDNPVDEVRAILSTGQRASDLTATLKYKKAGSTRSVVNIKGVDFTIDDPRRLTDLGVQVIGQPEVQIPGVKTSGEYSNYLNRLPQLGQKDFAMKPPVSPAKQPWEMTQSEFIRGETDKYIKDMREFAPEQVAKIEQSKKLSFEDFVAQNATDEIGGSMRHMREVDKALASGKPVPPEVLADYPDLKPPVSPAKQPTVKEPWEMTKGEFDRPDYYHGSVGGVDAFSEKAPKFNYYGREGIYLDESPDVARAYAKGYESSPTESAKILRSSVDVSNPIDATMKMGDGYKTIRSAVLDEAKSRGLSDVGFRVLLNDLDRHGPNSSLMQLASEGVSIGSFLPKALRRIGYDGIKEGGTLVVFDPIKVNIKERLKPNETEFFRSHRDIVQKALSEGKPVPPSVLADYPDLAKKYGAQGKQPTTNLTDLKSVATTKGAETKAAVADIIEGKAESSLGLKEFKTRMAAELDKIPTREGEVYTDYKYKYGGRSNNYQDIKVNQTKTAGQVVVGEHRIQIPGDGEFILKDGADIGEIRKKLRMLSEKEAWGPQHSTSGGYRGGYNAPSLQDALKSGEVTFTPNKPIERAPKSDFSGTSAAPTSRQATRTVIQPTVPVEGSVAKRDVIQYFEKKLGVPIRSGKVPPQAKALGFFRPKSEVIRSQEYGELNTISHEVGHALDKQLSGGIGSTRSFIRSLPKDMRAELTQMGKDLYGKRKPTAGYDREGFAEFIGHYLTGGTPELFAPKFAKQFSAMVDAKPDVKAFLENGRDITSKWFQQGAEARIDAAIAHNTPKQPIFETAGKVKDFLLREFDDALTPIRHFTEAAEKSAGRTLRGNENPFEMATALKSSAPAKASTWINESTIDFDGNVTGKGLKEIFTGVKGNEKAAIEYAYAKHGIERWKQGKNPGAMLADLEYFVDKHKSPEFEQFSKDLSAYRDRLLQYVVDAGAFDPQTAKLFRETYQSSIPLYREGFETSGHGGGGRGYGDLPGAYRRAHGSGREVINPIAGLLKETERMIGFADRARVGSMIAETAQKYEGLGKWVEKVTLPQKVNKVSADQVVQNFRDAGIELGDLPPAQLDKILTTFSQQVRGIPSDNVVTFYKNGKLQAYQLNPDLYGAVKQLDPWQASGLFKLLTVPKKMVAAGATALRPSFGLLTNLLRDPWSAMMQSKSKSMTPLQPLAGTVRVAANRLGLDVKAGLDTKNIDLWRRVGGEQANFFNAELPRAMDNAKRIISDNQLSKQMRVVKHPFDLYREILNTPEAGPRYSEFTKVYDKVLSETGNHTAAWVEALNASKNVTMNFGRAGRTAAIINQFVPFFNPGLQEPGLIARTFRANPTMTLARGIGGLTIPTIGLYYLNKDQDWYKATPTWEKAVFWHFKIGDRVWRLPKPFLWGSMFASFPEAALDSFEKHDQEMVKEMGKQIATNTIPNITPSFVSVPYALMAGETGWDSFRNRPIVPQGQVENLPPSERYGKYTSEFAKKVGGMFNVSPTKVDYAIGGFTGGLGSDIVQGVEYPFTNRPESGELANTPFMGRLVSRSPYLGKFYDEKDKLDERVKEIKIKSEGERTEEDKAVLDRAYGYGKVGDQLTEYRKQINGISKRNMPGSAKGKLIDSLNKQMDDLAHKVLFDKSFELKHKRPERPRIDVPKSEQMRQPTHDDSITALDKPEVYTLADLDKVPVHTIVKYHAFDSKTGEKIKLTGNARKVLKDLHDESELYSKLLGELV